MSGTPPLLAFYGDDFTGSTAVMEVLAFAGVPTMLFMDAPDAQTLARRPELRAVGVAGIARTRDPAWMREHLPPVFEALKRLGAPLVHYKVCSTFDSAPDIGSIGMATELGIAAFEPEWVPLLVGAPAIGRYQVFGQLFARAGETVHRLDRHPVMVRHPVTPMNEADLARHLAAQTDLDVGIVDLADMKAGRSGEALLNACAAGARIVALDALDDETLAEAGRLMWQGEAPSFAVGSQGVEYALVAHWRASGLVPADPQLPPFPPVDRIFAVSGSCAPTTAEQIDHAERCGFAVISFDAASVADERALGREFDRVRALALESLSGARDTIVRSASGPDDPAVARMAEAVQACGIGMGEANRRLGEALGRLVLAARADARVSRAVIAGGDTSGHALAALDAVALSAVAPLTPGAPLCRMHAATGTPADGLEVVLKGGQMGEPDIFVRAKGTRS